MRWGTQHLQRACRGHVGYSKQEWVNYLLKQSQLTSSK
jgi:hypothetical protein